MQTEHKRFFRTVRLFGMRLQWWVHFTRHLSKPKEPPKPRVDLIVNYELWKVMMCQRRFMDFTKHHSPAGFRSGEGRLLGQLCVCQGSGRVELSALSTTLL